MENFAGKRVVVAMSGGVDSSVTAALLKEQKAEVIGLTMQIWDYRNFAAPDGATFGTCCSLDDVYDARRVAEQLDVPFYVVNFEQEFERVVIDAFCADYMAGRTPNPCVLCNQLLKFELLLRRARELDADYLATGHYARVVPAGERYALCKGRDTAKDQSYFLFTLTQAQLAMVRFPLGDLSKKQVRAHAARFNLRVAEKAESQDICFVPDGDYVRFIEERHGVGSMAGEIVHVDGRVLGRHHGTYRYTIGQRRGLGLAWPEPLFVVAIDAAARRVVVGERRYLAVSSFTVDRLNWIAPPPSGPLEAACRIRYRHQEIPALIEPVNGNQATINLKAPQHGVTPGQAAVFYRDDEVLGGGWITKAVLSTEC